MVAGQPLHIPWAKGNGSLSTFSVFEESLPREALIKSLSDFILEFLCSARNGMTRIASYLRNSMTQQYIKILIKSDSAA